MSRASGKRATLFLAIGGLFTAALFILNSCADSIAPEPIAERPTVAIQGLEVTHVDESGKVVWKLIAESGEFFENKQQTEATDILILFFNTESEEVLRLESDSLTYDNRSGNLEMFGNIRAEDSTGKLFQTEQAIWDEDAKLLRGDAPIVAEQERIKVIGDSFKYDTEEKRLYVNQARFEWIPPDQEANES